MMIVAKFLGQSGDLGFINGKVYKLNLYLNTIRNLESVSMFCPYSSIESFLRNWEIQRVIQEEENK